MSQGDVASKRALAEHQKCRDADQDQRHTEKLAFGRGFTQKAARHHLRENHFNEPERAHIRRRGERKADKPEL